jgi:hypothetical protein
MGVRGKLSRRNGEGEKRRAGVTEAARRRFSGSPVRRFVIPLPVEV